MEAQKEYILHGTKPGVTGFGRNIKFPEGVQRIAFMAYIHTNGNIQATRRQMLANKDAIPGKKVPTARTLTVWSQNGMWKTLKGMVDEGLVDFLEQQNDPDIKEAIRSEATLVKFLHYLRSDLYVKMIAKGSPLYPRNNADAIKTLSWIRAEADVLDERMNGSRKRTGKDAAAVSLPSGTEVPNNVMSITKALQAKGIPINDENISREYLRIREEQEAADMA